MKSNMQKNVGSAVASAVAQPSLSRISRGVLSGLPFYMLFGMVALQLGVLGTLMTPLPAHAQDDTPPHPAPPAHIAWQLSVLQDGQETDQLSGVTAVGQSKTITRSHTVSHVVGCDGGHTQPTNLTRTITVAPLGVDDKGVIGFELSADETLEDPTPRTVRSDGCTLPPQTRTLSARHPELDVQSGQTASWTLLPKDPSLIYSLKATVAPRAQDD